jgi:hypothetical protein
MKWARGQTSEVIGGLNLRVCTMAVDNPDVVDAIGIERATGIVALTISDHLEWGDGDQHLLTLQAKINRYLAFIESGEVFESYPQAVGKTLRVDVVCKHPPSEAGVRFLAEARDAIEQAGWLFTWRVPEC